MAKKSLKKTTETPYPEPYRWSLPEKLQVPPDTLRARLDFYNDCILLQMVDENNVITTNMVSSRDIALALLSEVPLHTGILPQGALWWAQSREGVKVALWEPPKVWNLALQLDPFKPPRRMLLPMPGLIFVCMPARAPSVYAAKKKPKTLEDTVYKAPLFNLYNKGGSCAGTHKYPSDVTKIPNSFMISFFTATADHKHRSKKYPNDLLDLWNYIEGKKKYPLDDLVQHGYVKDIMEGG